MDNDIKSAADKLEGLEKKYNESHDDQGRFSSGGGGGGGGGNFGAPKAIGDPGKLGSPRLSAPSHVPGRSDPNARAQFQKVEKIGTKLRVTIHGEEGANWAKLADDHAKANGFNPRASAVQEAPQKIGKGVFAYAMTYSGKAKA